MTSKNNPKGGQHLILKTVQTRKKIAVHNIKQDRQCAHNVTLGSVYETTVAVKKE
jgi:hypothetical protein